VPFPSDRKSLLLLAEQTTSLLASMTPTGTPEESGRYALKLAYLGEVRLRLGEFKEAELLFKGAVVAYEKLGSAHDMELAAVARYSQASSAAADRRMSEALELVERMITVDSDFSMLKFAPQVWASAIELWLMLLEQVGDDARLYEASGIALELLEPAGPTTPLAVSRALFLRAQSAEALGRKEEAVALYERAIAQLEGNEASFGRDDYLNRAMLRVAVLLRELGRADEASDAVVRLEQFKGTRPFSTAMRTIGRLWARTLD
jgi:tetratricopeptide (TPR) repeat protein